MIERRRLIGSVLGCPYQAGATGPQAFDCFGLVACLALPLLGRAVPYDAAGILRARRTFQPVARPPLTDALVVMGQQDRHVGVWLAPECMVLHAVEGRGVVVDDLQALHFTGFGRPRFYEPR